MFESPEGQQVYKQKLQEINGRYDDAIEGIRHPERQDEEMEHPMIQASIRALDNARWEFMGARQVRAAI